VMKPFRRSQLEAALEQALLPTAALPTAATSARHSA
jgi:hypothetical protein